MIKKFLIISIIVTAVSFICGSIDLFLPAQGQAAAQESKCACKRGCDCDHCRGKSSVCDCAKKTTKCEKCGHERCPNNCNRCPDCVMEKMEERRKRSGY